MAATKTKTIRKVAASQSPAPSPLPTWLLASLLALVTIMLYWPASRNGFVNYDDDRYVTANAHVQRGLTFENIHWAFLKPVADNWKHPVTVFPYAGLSVLRIEPVGTSSGQSVVARSQCSVGFHTTPPVNRRSLEKFSGSRIVCGSSIARRISRMGAERKDVLSGFFGLLALIFYTCYAQEQNAKAPYKKGNGQHFVFSTSYWLAVFWFALGLMSKPMLVSWPFVMLLLDYWPLNRFSNLKSQIPNQNRVSVARSLLASWFWKKFRFSSSRQR